MADQVPLITKAGSAILPVVPQHDDHIGLMSMSRAAAGRSGWNAHASTCARPIGSKSGSLSGALPTPSLACDCGGRGHPESPAVGEGGDHGEHQLKVVASDRSVHKFERTCMAVDTNRQVVEGATKAVHRPLDVCLPGRDDWPGSQGGRGGQQGSRLQEGLGR